MTTRPGAFRVGDLVEVTIEKGVYRGRGLGRVGGRVVFVRRAHAGDRVRARVSELHAGWAEAALVEVLEPAPSRREAPCPYASLCGGCSYQELGYDEQLRLKEAVLRESLVRAGVPDPGPIPIHASPEQGWRMRASLHFAASRGELRLGLRQEGSCRVVDVERCLQLSQAMNEAARSLRAALASRPGLVARVRGLDLLESPTGGSLAAVLETTLRPDEAEALAALVRETRGLTGLGARCGRRLVWLYGTPEVDADVLGVKLRTHVDAFFQGNRFLLEPLAREVRDLVPDEGGRILDLYSGVGLFAVPLAAKHGCEVVAVEVATRAVEDARANAGRAGLTRMRVVAQDVARTLASLAPTRAERIVLDPPRTGAGPGVVDRIAAREPRSVLYVSCDPPTLGRDLARLIVRGYEIEAVRLFDLFPDTFHLETVVRLRPARAL